MKVLKVVFSNIHSLKGYFQIDFATGVLAEAGLFAITGQTGAGKSTILDAITLALYGQTNRHGNSKVDDQIITRNEKEAFSETTFEVNNEVYVARWAASYTKNWTLKGTERKIFRKTSDQMVLLFEGVSNTQPAINNIIGLNFDQFTKSVLLAQNNFSAFLKAKPSDRAEMLSKITGTQIYEDVSRAVFEQTVVLKDELTQLRAQLNANLLTDEACEALKLAIVDKLNQQELTKQHLDAVRAKVLVLQNYQSLQGEIANLMIQIQLQEQSFNDHKAQYDLLAQYQQALLVQNEFTIFQSVGQTLSELEGEIELTKNVLLQTSNQFELILEQDKVLTQSLHDAKSVLEHQIPAIEKAKLLFQDQTSLKQVLLDTELQLVSQQVALQTVQETLATCHHERKELEKQKIAIENQIIDHQKYALWESQKAVVGTFYKQIKSLEAELQNNQIQQTHTALSDLQVKLQDCRLDKETKLVILDTLVNELVALKEKFAKLDTFEVLNAKKEERIGNKVIIEKLISDLHFRDELLVKRLENHNQQLDFKQNIAEINIFILEQQDILALLKENLLLQQKLQSLEQYRHELVDGKPCPLCGAIDHPFAQLLPDQDLAVQNKVSSLEQVISDKVDARNAIEKQLIKLHTEDQHMEEQLHHISHSIASAESKLISDDFNQDYDLFLTTIIHQIELIDQTMLEVKEIADLIQKKEKLLTEHKEKYNQVIILENHLSSEIAMLTQTVNNYQNVLNEKEQTIHQAFLEVKLIFDQFQIELKEHDINEITAHGVMLTSKLKILTEAKLSLQLLKDEISVLDKKVAENQVQESNLISSVAVLMQKKTELEVRIEVLNAELKVLTSGFLLLNPHDEEHRLRSDLVNCQEKYNALQQLKSQTSTSLEEKKNIIEMLNLKYADVTQKYIQVKSTFEVKLKKYGFEHQDQLKLALSLTEPETLLLHKEENERKLEQYKGALNIANAKLNALHQEGLPSELLTVLEQESSHLESQQTLLNQEIGSLNERIRNNEIAFDQQLQKIKVIEEKDIVFQKWSQLNSLIGSKTGDSFKKFAQDFTLTLLVQHANKHLKIMFNRYELYKAEDSSEMELQIKDKHFFGEIRNINSLSGGETFLVSLSLALGLSDLASKNTKIRTLFIDEGFGTLDPENLNNALDALELLRQKDDRQIGIISHVEELKKRIHTQIQVNKVSAEFSNILIVD